MVAVTGGFPRGKTAGHNFDLVKAKLTNWLLELGLVTYTTTSSDFSDVQRWLPDCHFLITYVAGPVPEEGDNTYIQDWLSSGGRWLAIHGTSGGKADRTPGAVGMVKMVGPTAHFTGFSQQTLPGAALTPTCAAQGFHQTLGCRFLGHPPIRRFTVDVAEHPLTADLPPSFVSRKLRASTFPACIQLTAGACGA